MAAPVKVPPVGFAVNAKPLEFKQSLFGIVVKMIIGNESVLIVITPETKQFKEVVPVTE